MEHGRYIYIRDNDTADYWSASWQPVGKPLDKYKSECRHGTAYTVISSEYENIAAETAYYVPNGKTYEVWRSKITNNDSKPRKLSVFGFVEFTKDDMFLRREPAFDAKLPRFLRLFYKNPVFFFDILFFY